VPGRFLLLLGGSRCGLPLFVGLLSRLFRFARGLGFLLLGRVARRVLVCLLLRFFLLARVGLLARFDLSFERALFRFGGVEILFGLLRLRGFGFDRRRR